MMIGPSAGLQHASLEMLVLRNFVRSQGLLIALRAICADAYLPALRTLYLNVQFILSGNLPIH
jgi:hypothetical protein